jgi:hypothetical protein
MVPTKIKMIENLTWQSRMDNSETQATLDTRHRTKTQHRHKNTTQTQKHNTDNWKDEQHEHHQTKHILFPQNIKKLRL